jgi:hypothetical protein
MRVASRGPPSDYSRYASSAMLLMGPITSFRNCDEHFRLWDQLANVPDRRRWAERRYGANKTTAHLRLLGRSCFCYH